MNILFIGPYRQNDGWGLAAQNYVKSLVTTEHNISIKPIYMSNNIETDIDDQFVELENKHYEKYDCVIQNVLPHLFSHNCSVKLNILLCTFETQNMYVHPWSNYLINIKYILVHSLQEKKTLDETLLDTNVSNIGGAVSISLEDYSKAKPMFVHTNGDFTFYFVGEHTQRKNILGLVRAFYNEFDPTEPVSLIIKTNKSGLSSSPLKDKLTEEINNIKRTCRKYNRPEDYPQVVIITNHISNEDMLGLHKTCDCFIITSRGEAFCRPSIEALCLGKTPIITSGTGMDSFIDETNGYPVKSNQENIFTNEPPIQNIYTSHESWFNIDISDLQSTMRYVYLNKDTKEHKGKQKKGREQAYKFSYKQIGQNISRALNEYSNQ